VQLQASIQCGLDYCNTVLVRSWNSWHSDEKAAMKFRICSLFSDTSTTMRPYHYSMQPAVASSAVKNCIHEHSLACTYVNFAYCTGWKCTHSFLVAYYMNWMYVQMSVCTDNSWTVKLCILWTNSVDCGSLLFALRDSSLSLNTFRWQLNTCFSNKWTLPMAFRQFRLHIQIS